MTKMHQLLAGLALLGAVSLAQGQPHGTYGSPGHNQRFEQHREYREANRLKSYAQDVLRNNRRQCSTILGAYTQPDGKIVADCMNNKRQEVRYVLTPKRGNGYHIAQVQRPGKDRHDDRRGDHRDNRWHGDRR